MALVERTYEEWIAVGNVGAVDEYYKELRREKLAFDKWTGKYFNEDNKDEEENETDSE